MGQECGVGAQLYLALLRQLASVFLLATLLAAPLLLVYALGGGGGGEGGGGAAVSAAAGPGTAAAAAADVDAAAVAAAGGGAAAQEPDDPLGLLRFTGAHLRRYRVAALPSPALVGSAASTACALAGNSSSGAACGKTGTPPPPAAAAGGGFAFDIDGFARAVDATQVSVCCSAGARHAGQPVPSESLSNSAATVPSVHATQVCDVAHALF
jgi:hypothetical protein